MLQKQGFFLLFFYIELRLLNHMISDMDVARWIEVQDVHSIQQKIFVTFDLSKVKAHVKY